MGKVHVIRLRGPWFYEPVGRFERTALGRYIPEPVTHGLPPGGRTTVPDCWIKSVGEKFHGLVRYRRGFHQPTGLGQSEMVTLVVEEVRSAASITLNQHALGELHTGQSEMRLLVTHLLKPRNELEIVVGHPELQHNGWPISDSEAEKVGGIIGEVRLEIRTLQDD